MQKNKRRPLPWVLPDDLTVQILLRLPVKSLLRFMSVSRSWLSLISDPQFAPSHFDLAAARTHRLVFIDTSTLGGARSGARHLNGAIHWLAYRRYVIDNVILAFDLVEGSFSYIPLPNALGDFDDWVLWDHGGFWSLCLRCRYTTDIWVMKEYEVQSSWTKSVVLRDSPLCECLLPICCTKSSYIFGLDDDQDLVKCNAEGDRLWYLSFPRKSGVAVGEWKSQLFQSDAAMYTESLVSLPVGKVETRYNTLGIFLLLIPDTAARRQNSCWDTLGFSEQTL